MTQDLHPQFSPLQYFFHNTTQFLLFVCFKDNKDLLANPSPHKIFAHSFYFLFLERQLLINRKLNFFIAITIMQNYHKYHLTLGTFVQKDMP